MQQIQQLCVADDNPRIRMNTGDSELRDPVVSRLFRTFERKQRIGPPRLMIEGAREGTPAGVPSRRRTEIIGPPIHYTSSCVTSVLAFSCEFDEAIARARGLSRALGPGRTRNPRRWA